jgi:hypothetical protein
VSEVTVVSAIIPCLEEETAIGPVVTAVLAQNVDEVVVVDGGSKDRTVERARAAGARVIVEPRRGYGRAIQAGIAAVRNDAEIVVFLDGFRIGCLRSQPVSVSSRSARACVGRASPAASRHSSFSPVMSAGCSCASSMAPVSPTCRRFVPSDAMNSGVSA